MKKIISLVFIVSSISFANDINGIEFSNNIEEQRIENVDLTENTKEEKKDLLYFILNNNPDKGKYIHEKIISYSSIYNVDPAVIVSIIKRESNFKIEAESHVGAIGLMQLMPGTAKSMGIKNPWDIEENIKGGVRYFKLCLEKNKGNIPLALASYNAGIGAVLKYRGIPPYKETKNYVNLVLNTLSKITGGGQYTYNEVEFEKALKGIFSEISFGNAEYGEI